MNVNEIKNGCLEVAQKKFNEFTERCAKKFLLYLVSYKNPARGFNHFRSHVVIAKNLYQHFIENEIWGDKDVIDFFSNLIKWASMESLNKGSIMRNPCPVKLRGSGRWRAKDSGGHYKILRDLLIWSVKSELYDYKKKQVIDVYDDFELFCCGCGIPYATTLSYTTVMSLLASYLLANSELLTNLEK